MKPTNILLALSLVLGASLASHAQVGIGTATPAASSALDITSTTKGLLVPRMTQTQRNAISSPATWLIVICTDCGNSGELQVYNGTTWTNMIGGTASAAVPDSPTSPVATAGNAQASVAFTAPVSNGSSAITGYTVTSSPGGIMSTGTSSPLIVTGLTNGTAYTFTVVATNAVGNSVASAASATITPTAVPTPNVTNPTTGKIWMDRNLGASQVAISSNDAASYGDLYQWGRGADGHQTRTSATTSTLSSTDVPGNASFILITSGSNYDWRSPQNVNLWQGVNGVNNPCPTGYRIPTQTELDAERLSWSTNNKLGAFASPLKLPVAGNRNPVSGSLEDVGTFGIYWSSTVNGNNACNLTFYTSASMGILYRALGGSVRCLKD